jgi:hypothetical protein
MTATPLRAGDRIVSQIYEMKLRTERKPKLDGINANDMKGEIGLRADTVLPFVFSTTPDDPVTIAKLQAAAQKVLKADLE